MQENREKQYESGGLVKVPSGYTTKAKHAGKIEIVTYQAKDYRNGAEMEKQAYVYLPYEYDAAKKYPIVYCLHGGEGNVLAYLGTPQEPGVVAHVLNHMIANGDIEPVIAVAPSYYRKPGENISAVADIENFKEELLNDTIPAIEGRYSTYAETTDREGVKASRAYRAYTGFSMGSLSTWVTLLQSNDYFKYYMPMSGDCWIDGSSDGMGAAELLENTYRASGYQQEDIFVFAVTGDKDIAYERMKHQIECMVQYSPSFVFTNKSKTEGNITFRVEPGATHDYIYLPLYIYNGLRMFFGEK